MALVLGASATAQTNVTTSNGGTPGTIPYFTSSSNIENSIMSQSATGYILINGGSLAAANGATNTLLKLDSTNANLNSIVISQFRQVDQDSGDLGDWITATSRIANWTDVSQQGYIDFNPTTYNGNAQAALAFGFGSTEYMRFRSNGYAGIGTTYPTQMLEVNGNIQVDGQIQFADGSSLSSASSIISSPSSLNVGGSGLGGLIVPGANLDPTLSSPYSLALLENSGKLLIGTNYSAGLGELDLIENRNGGAWGGFSFYDYSNTGQMTPLLTIIGPGSPAGPGNVGIGTTTPGAKLEVNGNVKLTAGSAASITFPDNTVQSTAWNGTLPGGDYAESVDVLGDRDQYEPGDVIVIDDLVDGEFTKSNKPYSQLVAGVYSTKPGLVGRRTTTGWPDKEAEVPMAIMGIVPTKVTTENGPINRGDLLVSSSTPGYAMKGTDGSRLTGAVIGKALAPLKVGSGLIEVLVSLQ